MAGRRSVRRPRYPRRPRALKRVDYWVMQAARRRLRGQPRGRRAALAAGPDAAADAVHARARPRRPRRPGRAPTSRRCPRCSSSGTAAPATASDWDGPDDLRPLDERGPRAGPAAGRGAAGSSARRRCCSAPPVRCRQTVAPLAEALGLDVAPGCRSSARRSSRPTRRPGSPLVERLLAPADRPGRRPSSAARAGRSRRC